MLSLILKHDSLDIVTEDPVAVKAEKISEEALAKLRDWKTQEIGFGIAGGFATIFKPFPFNWLTMLTGHFKRPKKERLGEVTVVLVHNKNLRNFYSGFDRSRGSLFVQVTDWKTHVPGVEPVFLIAFEMLSTLLRYMMWPDQQTYLNDAHIEPVGCINDHSADKSKVIVKLRGADICEDCLARIKEEGVSLAYVEALDRQIQEMRDKIRLSKVRPDNLSLRIQGCTLLFDDFDLEITLTPIQALLMHFFVKHPEGVDRYKLGEHRKELLNTYISLKRGKDQDNAKKSIDSLCDSGQNTFFEHHSRLLQKVESAIRDGANYLPKLLRESGNNSKYIIDPEYRKRISEVSL